MQKPTAKNIDTASQPAREISYVGKHDVAQERNVIERLQTRHPHFRRWLSVRGRIWFEVPAIQYAVIDKWRRKCSGDLDELYERLAMEVTEWNERYGDRLPLVEKDEFAEAMDLYPLMVLNRPWPTSGKPTARRQWEMAELGRKSAIEYGAAHSSPGFQLPPAKVAPVSRPCADAVSPPLSEASLRLERWAARMVTINLFAKAVGQCIAYPKASSVRAMYQMLEWTVAQQGGHGLPSESTFRRTVHRERERRFKGPPEASRSTTMSKVEATLIRELIDKYRRQRT